MFVLHNPLTFKERIFNLCAILFYGGDKKFINMMWLWWLKTGKNNKLKLTALNIFKNKINKRKKTQLKRLWDRQRNNKTRTCNRKQNTTKNLLLLGSTIQTNCERFKGL